MKKEQGQNSHRFPRQWCSTKAKNKGRDLGARKNSVFGHFSRSEQLNVGKFQVSNGWLYTWKSRCIILFKEVTGQSASVASKMAASWKEMSLS